MRKYSTGEAIAMLEQNPKLRFKSQLGNEIYVDKDGNIRWRETETTRGDIADLHHLFMKNTWELIQQPVPFLEAVKAYSEGKAIRCEFTDKSSTVFKPNIEFGAFKPMKDATGGALTDTEILEGTWFVED